MIYLCSGFQYSYFTYFLLITTMKKSIALILLFSALFLISCQQKGGSKVSGNDSTVVELQDSIVPVQVTTVPDSCAQVAGTDNLPKAE